MLIGAVVIPLAAFLGIAWWGLREAQRDAESAAAAAAVLAGDHAERTFAIALDVAQATARITSGPDEEVRRGEAAYRQRLGDMTYGLPSIVNMNVWDADGRPLVRSDRAVEPTSTVADRDYFQAQQDASVGVALSGILIGRQTGRELMNVVIRRPSADGSFRGVVAVSVSPGYFREFYQSVAAGDKGLASFALVRDDGEILARWPPAPDGRTRVPPERETMRRIAAGEVSGTHLVPAEGLREARRVSFRRVDGLPAFVVAGFSRDAVDADWMRFLAVLAAAIVPISAVLVLVSWVALRKTRIEHTTARELREALRKGAVAERAMLESQKLETLAVLTGGVAHDFNNLLAIIDTSLHVHRRRHAGLADDPPLKAMQRAIRSGVRLTRQLLSFSRKQALKPETLQLQTWLPAVAELVRSTLGRRIACEFTVDPATAPVCVDAAEFELALINLALNARHAMPDGGSFHVHARNLDGGDAVPHVEIRVEDTGAGIPPELLTKVVEPFFTTRARGSGSGLGLSQVKGFCEQAGGRLALASTEGQGTTVAMQFPAAPPAAGEPVAGPLPDTPRLQGLVLLVDDNEEVARSTEAMLVAAGLAVVVAKSADDALARLDGGGVAPDLVLSDIAMPGSLSGIDLAFRLRKERPGLPVLLTTGYASQIDDAVAGGFEVMPKPVPPEHLLRRLARDLPPRR